MLSIILLSEIPFTHFFPIKKSFSSFKFRSNIPFSMRSWTSYFSLNPHHKTCIYALWSTNTNSILNVSDAIFSTEKLVKNLEYISLCPKEIYSTGITSKYINNLLISEKRFQIHNYKWENRKATGDRQSHRPVPEK